MVIKGGIHKDERGIIKHVNGFDMTAVKRFYSIQHPDTTIIRAWQGHKKETKYFYVVKGEFAIAKVKIDNWLEPSKNLTVEKIILSENNPELLMIEPGYANGFKALIPDSILLIYSDLTLDESANDIIRFPENYWTL